VTILNRFGHGLSQSQLSEVEAAVATQICNRSAIFLPSNISSGSVSTMCWDSIDFAEGTPTGMGTSHCTNRIIVQRVVTQPATLPHLPQPQSFSEATHRRRSVDVPPALEFEYTKRPG
jgi:hypothetical protein